jgi:hypothetical protein
MRATGVGRARRRPHRYAEGRVCATEGCQAQLSRYNSFDHCYLHTPAHFVRLRGEFSESWVGRHEG